MKSLNYIFLLSLLSISCNQALSQTNTRSTELLHKDWKWQSFKSLTQAFINIEKFDLDLRYQDTLVYHSYNEEMTSMHSMVTDSLIQKTIKIKEKDSPEFSKSSYQVIGNVLLINDERFKNKMSYKIKSLGVSELILIVHLKIKTEDGKLIEGDVGEITFRN